MAILKMVNFLKKIKMKCAECTREATYCQANVWRCTFHYHRFIKALRIQRRKQANARTKTM